MSERTRKVSAGLREVLAQAISELKDPRVGMVTVTEVRTSPDLRHAQVFYTSLPDEAEAHEATAAGLESASSLLRRQVGERLKLRFTPTLRFTADPVPARGRRIEDLLREASAERSQG